MTTSSSSQSTSSSYSSRESVVSRSVSDEPKTEKIKSVSASTVASLEEVVVPIIVEHDIITTNRVLGEPSESMELREYYPVVIPMPILTPVRPRELGPIGETGDVVNSHQEVDGLSPAMYDSILRELNPSLRDDELECYARGGFGLVTEEVRYVELNKDDIHVDVDPHVRLNQSTSEITKAMKSNTSEERQQISLDLKKSSEGKSTSKHSQSVSRRSSSSSREVEVVCVPEEWKEFAKCEEESNVVSQARPDIAKKSSGDCCAARPLVGKTDIYYTSEYYTESEEVEERTQSRKAATTTKGPKSICCVQQAPSGTSISTAVSRITDSQSVHSKSSRYARTEGSGTDDTDELIWRATSSRVQPAKPGRGICCTAPQPSAPSSFGNSQSHTSLGLSLVDTDRTQAYTTHTPSVNASESSNVPTAKSWDVGSTRVSSVSPAIKGKRGSCCGAAPHMSVEGSGAKSASTRVRKVTKAASVGGPVSNSTLQLGKRDGGVQSSTSSSSSYTYSYAEYEEGTLSATMVNEETRSRFTSKKAKGSRCCAADARTGSDDSVSRAPTAKESQALYTKCSSRPSGTVRSQISASRLSAYPTTIVNAKKSSHPCCGAPQESLEGDRSSYEIEEGSRAPSNGLPASSLAAAIKSETQRGSQSATKKGTTGSSYSYYYQGTESKGEVTPGRDRPAKPSRGSCCAGPGVEDTLDSTVATTRDSRYSVAHTKGTGAGSDYPVSELKGSRGTGTNRSSSKQNSDVNGSVRTGIDSHSAKPKKARAACCAVPSRSESIMNSVSTVGHKSGSTRQSRNSLNSSKREGSDVVPDTVRSSSPATRKCKSRKTVVDAGGRFVSLESMGEGPDIRMTRRRRKAKETCCGGCGVLQSDEESVSDDGIDLVYGKNTLGCTKVLRVAKGSRPEQRYMKGSRICCCHKAVPYDGLSFTYEYSYSYETETSKPAGSDVCESSSVIHGSRAKTETSKASTSKASTSKASTMKASTMKSSTIKAGKRSSGCCNAREKYRSEEESGSTSSSSKSESHSRQARPKKENVTSHSHSTSHKMSTTAASTSKSHSRGVHSVASGALKKEKTNCSGCCGPRDIELSDQGTFSESVGSLSSLSEIVSTGPPPKKAARIGANHRLEAKTSSIRPQFRATGALPATIPQRGLEYYEKVSVGVTRDMSYRKKEKRIS